MSKYKNVPKPKMISLPDTADLSQDDDDQCSIIWYFYTLNPFISPDLSQWICQKDSSTKTTKVGRGERRKINKYLFIEK